MSESVPQIKVTSNGQDGQSSSPSGETTKVEGSTWSGAPVRVKSPDNVDGNARSSIRTGKILSNISGTNAQSVALSKENKDDSRRDSQAIDPLSHHILKRTNSLSASKTRSIPPQESNSTLPEAGASIAASRKPLEPGAKLSESSILLQKERRNRGSFFSRFAPKKKDSIVAASVDDVSEAGDGRTEGMDADVFSQPIGYVPQFPPPPKYIKVRSHGRKQKDFDRIFLAQELKGRTGVEIAQSGGRLPSTASTRAGQARKDGNAIWAIEFSKDGKHLAAGGKDYIVRVWAVLSSKEDRHAHESDENSAGKEGEGIRLNAPVFQPKTVQEYSGHTASILDLSWSKNNFLLSSSMDKTVRLWHVSREECLCCFKHSDFVTSIQFHPKDDRFFLAGSLDSKLRLWSIPDKSVAYWSELPEFITAVAFTPDGKTAIAGCLNGLCLFFETEGLKHQSQIHVRSAHGKNAKGSKVTGIQAIHCPPDESNGEIKLLITSNDSRIRVYNFRDKGLELKLKGNENSCSQIRASFSDDARYIICGSEDCKAYIWPTQQSENEKDKRPVEMFEAHSAIVTTAIIAPTSTRKLLSASGDPLYDLCNPPPVTLVSRTHSEQSSIPQTEDVARHHSLPTTPGISDGPRPSKPEESPAYLARCAHSDGNIIITADFNGQIKVFRQDCAFQNRLRNSESGLSKKMLGRTNSVATRHSNRSRRDSLQINHNHSSDRILSWRQSINSTTGSVDSFRNSGNGNIGGLSHKRSISPRKSLGQMSMPPSAYRQGSQSARLPQTAQFPAASGSPDPSPPHRTLSNEEAGKKSQLRGADDNQTKRPYAALPLPDKESNPLMLQGEQSYMFWNRAVYRAQAAAAHTPHLRDDHLGDQSTNASTPASSNISLNEHGQSRGLGVPLGREVTAISRLSSEDGSSNGAGDHHDNPDAPPDDDTGDQSVSCRRCGGDNFRVRKGGAKDGGRSMECANCGLEI